MSRVARQVSPTNFYHVTARGINQEMVLGTSREKEYFLKIIHEQVVKEPIKMYAFCIMDNHIHFLINAELDALSSFMANVLAKYAKFYNFKHERIGYVFQDRFHSECITDENYLWNCFRYIHQNPVKAHKVKTSLRYKYCSMREYYERNPYIIHQHALEQIQKRFPRVRELVEFQKMSCPEVFYDTEEDLRSHRLELALEFLQEQIREFRMEPDVIWAGTKTRKECMEKAAILLKASVRETTEILEIVIKKLGTC